MLAFETDCHIFDGCGFPAPGLHSFVFEPLFTVGGFDFNKPMLLALLGTVVVVGFFWAAFSKPKIVPGQAADGRPRRATTSSAAASCTRRIGKKEGEKYVPLMVSLFFFVWIMNLWSIIPLAQFPVTSVIAFPAVLALIVYILWVSLTFKRHGFVGGWKNITGYDKSLGPVLPLVDASSSSSRTCSSGRSRTRCDSSRTCSPATCCCCCSPSPAGTC